MGSVKLVCVTFAVVIECVGLPELCFVSLCRTVGKESLTTTRKQRSLSLSLLPFSLSILLSLFLFVFLPVSLPLSLSLISSLSNSNLDYSDSDDDVRTVKAENVPSSIQFDLFGRHAGPIHPPLVGERDEEEEGGLRKKRRVSQPEREVGRERERERDVDGKKEKAEDKGVFVSGRERERDSFVGMAVDVEREIEE